MVRRFLFLFMLSLAGCSTAPIQEQDQRQALWAAHQAQLQMLDDWYLSARLALRVNDEGYYASINWRQEKQGYELKLYDPFGRQVGELNASGEKVLLRTQEGQEISAERAEQLLYDIYGWDLPLSGLRYWVLGLTTPESPAFETVLNENGVLYSVKQEGWQIRYDDYLQREHYLLPKKVSLYRPDLSVKLVIKDFREL